MKLSSKLLVKATILLSVVIAASSGLYAQRAQASLVAKKAVISKLEQEQRGLMSVKADTEALAASAGAPPTIEQSLADTLVVVLKERLESGILISSVTPQTTSPGNDAVLISSLSEKVGTSDIKSARVNVRGVYTTYEGLQAYIRTIQKLPVAVVFLKVEAQNFELGLRAYGT
jgi:hypothetical protein